MKVSRAPEKRGGTGKLWLYLVLIAAIVIAGILTMYYTVGFESLFATGDETGQPAGPAPLSTVVAPDPVAVPGPTPVDSQLPFEPATPPRVIPDVKFGEVLSEGMLEVVLPGEITAECWYTFQVDTATRDITLFFALYGVPPEIIVRTVKIDGYSRQGALSRAEVTLFHPEGPERLIAFDGNRGVITLSQKYTQPYGPSIFSPGLRVAMVNQQMELTDETGTISAQLQLDLSGLSDSEHLIFERADPRLVESALAEIRALADQIEGKRNQ
jgi:hypothetical protein